MPYRDKLEARIAKKTTQAITTFGLVEEGDRILVALSGGKDSWALLQILDELRRRAEIEFSLFAVTIDSGYEGFATDRIASACEARGWPFQLVRTSIGSVMDEVLEPDETPCSLCGRLRRGVLYRIARETGATKIALGHHADDCLETLLLNLFFEGALKAMPARLVSDNGHHVVIRPLVYVSEADTSAYAATSGLPVVSCCCRACGDLELEAAADQAPAVRSRARAPGGEEFDAQGAAQRGSESSARLAPASGAGAERGDRGEARGGRLG